MKIIILISLLIQTYAWALPEDGLSTAWREHALPYFNSFDKGEGEAFHFYSKTNPTNNKILVILPGRTEAAIKYAEVMYDLRNKGLDFYIIDHRGQGLSPRILKDSQKGHVEYFYHYVNDLSELMENVVIPSSQNKEIYLLAHSMGAAIAVKYMAKNPQIFAKATLSAPMLEINTAPYSEPVAYIYSKLLVLLKKGTDYAPGTGLYQSDEDTFENNTVTRSLARFELNKSLYTEDPRLLVWAPTVNWVYQSLKATKHIDQLGHQIETPILLFNAEKDQIVKKSRQIKFCHNARCELIVMTDSEHEILMERDEIRNKALGRITEFFNL